MNSKILALLSLVFSFSLNCLGQNRPSSSTTYDVLIRNGLIYDGSGQKPYRGDVGIRADRVVAIGKLTSAKATTVIDANGMAVAPGFINVLSHAGLSLLKDGRSMSDLKQGVTTEVFGEISWGPFRPNNIPFLQSSWFKEFGLTCDWTTLAEFMHKLERKGVTPNFASYVGAGEVRMMVLGENDVKPNPAQLVQMQTLVREAMEGGALGVTTMLIYPPNTFADTDELIALCREAARYKGRYIVHMRSEGDRLEEGIEELIRIGKEAKLPVELYHFKASGVRNWPKVDKAIALIEQARKQGQDVTANMYTYTAGGTGLTSCLPPYVFNGGFMAGWKRLQDPSERSKIAQEVRHQTQKWENMFALAGSPDNIVPAGFEQDSLKKYEGKTLGEIAKIRGKDPVETVMDLIVQDKSRVGTLYFLMSEENIKKQIRQPWVSFGSDAGSVADTVSGKGHPREFGNFARLLGKYVREEKVIPLEEAIRRLSSLPATNHKLANRGFLKPGYFADVVIFDPATIADKATFENSFQYAVGVQHVFINGKQVLNNGEHTGVLPGRALWGPSWKPEAKKIK
ncbi:amidohydrolase family protein [Spirosoma sp. HMF4905]|uniref:Amidohydrolase family protein n=1 Tax=Spirosoma arboris TaxID=2682092 RepID=A0A7K1S5D2_9BACT|nr:D-aminoacylase [Spirosoma arboris]MVM29029.1 amidohydrolase family protein [Spirosoma arboris]